MKKSKVIRQLYDKTALIQNLIEKNPEIQLAKKIMLQARKTQRPVLSMDKSNYYKVS